MLRLVCGCAALILFGLLFLSDARADGRFQEYEDKPGCYVWISNPQPNLTVTWAGNCADERSIGHGVETWRYFDDNEWKEIIYTGEMRDGLRNGHGILEWPNHDRYEGEFEDGYHHGHGVYEWSGGARYEGEWRKNERHGNGIFFGANGGKYEGQWQDGKRHGHGVSVWANGARYEGEYRNGFQHGHG